MLRYGPSYLFISKLLIVLVLMLCTQSWAQNASIESNKINQSPIQDPINVGVGNLVVLFQPDLNSFYPSSSMSAGEHGEVVVRLIVDERGIVEEARILQSSSYSRLDRAALEIGKRHVFKPYLINGIPTKLSTSLLVRFNPRNPKGTEENNNLPLATEATPLNSKVFEKSRADQLARLKAAAEGRANQIAPTYADLIRGRIKPLIKFNTESIVGNPTTVVLVDLAPNGTILNRVVISSSGDPLWDSAVLNAIDRAGILPRDENGNIPQQIKIHFRPK